MANSALLPAPVREVPDRPSDRAAEALGEPSGQNRPRWRSKLAWILGTLCVFGAGWVIGSGAFAPREKEMLPPEPERQRVDAGAVVVTTEPVAFRPVQRAVEALGTLHGFEEISICARVEGRVRKLCVDVADRVQPGALLLEIESTDYELSVEQAKRALQVELAELGLTEMPGPAVELELEKVPAVMLARARMENAQLRIERVRKLVDTGAVSTEDSDNATSEYRVTQSEYANQLLIAKARLATIQMKQASLAIAEQQLSETRVCAPTPSLPIPGAEQGITYAVTGRSVAEGSLVRPGTEVCRLVINQILKLHVPVPERYSADIQLGQQADIQTVAFRHPFTGTVTRINPAADPVTRTFDVEIQVPNPDVTLKPGGFAKANILTRLDADAATVPLSAVTNFAGINKVFLADHSRAKEIQVELGVQTTRWVEITHPPLPDGARIITSGQTVLANDTAIEARDAAPETETQPGTSVVPPAESAP